MPPSYFKSVDVYNTINQPDFCLLFGTKVTKADGNVVNIEDLSIGDKTLNFIEDMWDTGVNAGKKAVNFTEDMWETGVNGIKRKLAFKNSSVADLTEYTFN